MDDRQMAILNRVKAGEISAEEGARLLAQLEEAPQPEAAPAPAEAPVVHQASADELASEDINSFKRFWLVPFWIGFGVLVFSAGMMFVSWSNAQYFWYFCSWLPMALGIIILVSAVWSRTARWIHVRVREQKEDKNTNIRISFPIPIRLAGWALRFAKPYVPQMKDQDWVETVVPILDTLGSSREPMIVEVNEHENEKVQVYIL